MTIFPSHLLDGDPPPSPLTCWLSGHGLEHVQRRVEPLLLNRSGGAPVSGLPPLVLGRVLGVLGVHGGGGSGGDLMAVPAAAGIRPRVRMRRGRPCSRVRTGGWGVRVARDRGGGGGGGGRLRRGGVGSLELGIRPQGEPAGAVASRVFGRPAERRPGGGGGGGGEGGARGGLPPSGFGAAREHSSFRRRLALRSHRRLSRIRLPDPTPDGDLHEARETRRARAISPSLPLSQQPAALKSDVLPPRRYNGLFTLARKEDWDPTGRRQRLIRLSPPLLSGLGIRTSAFSVSLFSSRLFAEFCLFPLNRIARDG